MKDEGEGLQAVRSGQAPRKPQGRVTMRPEPVAFWRARKVWALGTVEIHKGLVDQEVLGSQGESVRCLMTESKVRGGGLRAAEAAANSFSGERHQFLPFHQGLIKNKIKKKTKRKLDSLTELATQCV